MRDRILDAAQRCFYERGITATGVDALAEEAGISKRTLYNHFGGKDEVVTAYLERREQRWRDRLDEALTGVDDPVERIVSYVRTYCRNDDLGGERGCPFINAAAEFPGSSHPGLAVIQGSVANVEQGIAEILREAGVRRPEGLAGRLLLVLEGAMSVAGIRRDGAAYAVAEDLVRDMVESALRERAGNDPADGEIVLGVGPPPDQGMR